MTYGDRTSCKACGREIVQLSGGHRQRQYCDDNCRQDAFRRRQAEKHLEELRQRWAGFTPETQVYLDWLMTRYGEDLASSVAIMIAREIKEHRRNRSAGQV